MEEGAPEEMAFELGVGDWWTCPRRGRAFQAEGKSYVPIGRCVQGEDTNVGTSALPRNSKSLVMGLTLGICIFNKLPWAVRC